jgi:hypothetical protein
MVVKAAVEFISSLLGKDALDKVAAIKRELCLSHYVSSNENLSDQDLLKLIKDICIKKNFQFPDSCGQFLLTHLVEDLVRWYQGGEIETNEAMLYFEEYVKGNMMMAPQVVHSLAFKFPALALCLCNKWNIVYPQQLTETIAVNRPFSMPLIPQTCNKNIMLHSLVSAPGVHHISSLEEWSEALKKLKAGSIISLFHSGAISPTSPMPKLGALALFVKLNEEHKVGNLYFIIPSLCGPELTHKMFCDFQDLLLQQVNGKRLLIFQQHILDVPQLAFLKRRVPGRDGSLPGKFHWILDTSLLASQMGDEPTLSGLTMKVTGGPMCNRAKHSFWSVDGGTAVVLHHLGMRCVIVMEYAIRDDMLKSEAAQELRQTMRSAFLSHETQ